MSALETRFAAELRGGGPAPGERVVVALSGGLDSVVLLHLLRFGRPQAGLELHAAHFDHAMRPSSRDDALWVAGLCRAWGVPLVTERAQAAPKSEEAAREIRYGFLERARARVGARLVLTAHHADDQAETVLFRAVRGTGPSGLAGIPAGREPGILRPLLGFWREELERHAERARLSWRDDPSNIEFKYARNALRGRILPEIERLVAPGARRALVRLADLAREDEAGWASVLPALMAPLRVEADDSGVSLDREAFVALHPAVQARILRSLAADVGVRFDEAGVRSALQLATTALSGRGIDLGGAWTMSRELDRVVLSAGRTVPPDEPLLIRDSGPGLGAARIAGERIHVVWGRGVGEGRPGPGTPRHAERFDPEGLRFPLMVRAREPGDRIRLAAGTKKVKKLFLERRIPTPRRERIPLLVDAEGDVLWIPEVARAEPRQGRAEPGALRIGIG